MLPRDEMQSMLAMIEAGNATTGGLQRVCTATAVLGSLFYPFTVDLRRACFMSFASHVLRVSQVLFVSFKATTFISSHNHEKWVLLVHIRCMRLKMRSSFPSRNPPSWSM